MQGGSPDVWNIRALLFEIFVKKGIHAFNLIRNYYIIMVIYLYYRTEFLEWERSSTKYVKEGNYAKPN